MEHIAGITAIELGEWRIRFQAFAERRGGSPELEHRRGFESGAVQSDRMGAVTR